MTLPYANFTSLQDKYPILIRITFVVWSKPFCFQLDVLNRQYARYFSMDITEKTQSARSHNIDAEDIMGLFSAAQKRAPNATLCFLSYVCGQ